MCITLKGALYAPDMSLTIVSISENMIPPSVADHPTIAAARKSKLTLSCLTVHRPNA